MTDLFLDDIQFTCFIVSLIFLTAIIIFLISIYFRQKRIEQQVLENNARLDLLTDSNLNREIPHATDNSSSESDTKEGFIPGEESKRREELNRNTIYRIMDSLGCNPKIGEDNNIGLTFEGERFLIMCNGVFLRIWDLSWLSIKTTNDDFPLFRDAANYANFSFGPSIIMHSPDENGEVTVSSRFDVPFFPEHEDNKEFLIACLESFFALKTSLQREVARLKEDPTDRTILSNPIGFDTATLSDPSSPQAN